MPTTKYFPFVKGLNQTTDDRLLEPGTPRAIENLVIEKLGRLRMRYDYDALAMTSPDTNLRLYDLHILNGQLLALTQFDNASEDTAPVNHIQGIHVYNGVAAAAWVRISQPALPVAARVRNIGFTASQVASVSLMDVAAGNGLVAMFWLEDSSAASLFEAIVRIFRASTGERIGRAFNPFVGTNFTRLRIIFIGGKFFMSGVDTPTNTIRLTSYDPVTDTVTALTDPLPAQANAITCMDMSLSHEGTSFWLAFGLANTTTGLRGYDSTGAQTYTSAGPAVLADAITVLAEATNGTNRVNVLIQRNATGNIDAYTFVPPTAGPVLNSANIFTPDTTTRQPVMCMRTANNNHVTVLYQKGNDIQQRAFNDTTHALVAVADCKLFDSRLTSKIMSIRGQRFAACQEIRAVTPLTVTNMLYQWTNLMGAGLQFGRTRPTTFDEVNFGGTPPAAHLPAIAFDISTALSYWGRVYVSEFIGGNSTKQLPIVSEMALVETSRRQGVQMGPDLYLTGGVTMVVDGTSAAESGGFLVSPRLSSISAGAAGNIATGTYQLVAFYELYNSQRERIQGIPSAVFTIAVVGPTGSITLSVSVPHTFWDATSLLTSRAPGSGIPVISFYRTKDNGGGNLTFYREKSVSVAAAVAGVVTTTLTLIDSALEVNEILYTQGARGALSGPLPFEVADPSVSIAASADKLLIGGLPDTANIQESRPLFPAEPIQWSQSIAFLRGTRGSVLAVARLDERRIAFTATELFELDGPGVDDNGIGDIGAPRRLPSDVGLFGGLLGWRSIVECSLGIMFQGLADQIYLLPRGGNTPQNIGLAIQDKLAAFPSVVAAVYCADDRTVRFTCNNSATAPTDSVSLIYDLIHQTWITEGPYGAASLSSALYQNRPLLLQSNIVRQQRISGPPAALIANAWRSGTIHPFGLGQFGRVLNYQFYGEYQGDCTLKCIATYDDQTVETMQFAEVNATTLANLANASNVFLNAPYSNIALAAGDPFSFKFTPNQIKCECVRVDFEVDVPFPNVVFAQAFSNLTATNSLALNLATNRLAGDRIVIVIMQSNTGANGPTLAGWTQRFTGTTTGARQTVLERILDGSEPTSTTFTWTGTATASFSNLWTIRNSHATAPIEVANLVAGPGSTFFGSGAPLTPSWGALNTRWLSVLAIDDRPAAPVNVTATPAGFSRGVNVSNVSATANLSGQVEGGDRALNIATLTPLPWAWTDPSDARVLTIAVRPSATLASSGLVYHYWAMDIDEAGKSALKSPLQMG